MSRSRKRVNYCEESDADVGGGSGKKRVAAVNSSDSDSIEFVEERKPVKKAAKKATTPKIASSTSDLVAPNNSNEKVSAGESINTIEPTSSLLFGDVADKSGKTEEIPSYNVEVACSGRAQCRRCDELIPKNNIRVGIEAEGDWGLFTKWHHLNCTIFHKSITNSSQIRGYDLLDAVSLAALDKRVSDSLNEVDKDATPLDPDELVRVEWNEQMNPPSDLLMPLLPFQKEGLGWMVHQEDLTIKDNALGGILADEMGMGKTIQTISLILTNRPPTAIASSGKNSHNELTMQEWQKSDVRHNSTYALNPLPRGATLIIVPTIAIRQWQAEILRFTKSKSLVVRIYHGSDRECSVEDFAKADVVITSYKIVEIEYRKATQNIKVTCSICNKKFYPEKLRIHRKYFCGESAQRTVAQSKTEKKKLHTDSSAAAAASPVADEEEEDEISKQKKANKKGKKSKSNDLEDDVFEDPEVERDILDAMKEYKDANRHRAKVVSIMHMISWFRIVLDEAHVIKDRSTSTAKAVYGLVSLYKWCLSGTPLQNRVSELYSLVRFLRIDPYAYYQCKVKSCNCKSLHYRFTGGKCDQCQHGNMVHYSHFNKHILNPIKVNGYKNEG
jgi:DNA repair protein RAD16